MYIYVCINDETFFRPEMSGFFLSFVAFLSSKVYQQPPVSVPPAELQERPSIDMVQPWDLSYLKSLTSTSPPKIPLHLLCTQYLHPEP